MGRARRVLNSKVRKIKSPHFRPSNTLSSGISHTEIDATISELVVKSSAISSRRIYWRRANWRTTIFYSALEALWNE